MKLVKTLSLFLLATLFSFTLLAEEVSFGNTRDANPPIVSDQDPAVDETNVSLDTDIFFKLSDTDGVDINSVTVDVISHARTETFSTATPEKFIYSGSAQEYSIVLIPTGDFTYGETVIVQITASDNADPANTTDNSVYYSFTTRADTQPPYVLNFSPPEGDETVPVDENITFNIKDSGIGVDLNSITVTINSYTYQNQPATYQNAVYTVANAGIFSYSGNPNSYNITINPPQDFSRAGEIVHVNVNASDLYSTPNQMADYFRTFRVVNESEPPVSSEWNPAPDEQNVPRDTNISFNLYDEFVGQNNVDITSVVVKITVNGDLANQRTYNYLNSSFSYEEVQYGYNVTIDPSVTDAQNFYWNDNVEVTIDAKDLTNPPNSMVTKTYSFYIIDDLTPPTITNIDPADNATNVDAQTSISFDLNDTGYGIDDNSIFVTVKNLTQNTQNVYSLINNSTNFTLGGTAESRSVLVEPLANSWTWLDDIEVTVIASDLSPNNNNNDLNYTFNFEIQEEDNEAPFVSELSPADAATDVPVNTDIEFYVLDSGSGVVENSIALTVNGNLIPTADLDIISSTLYQSDGFKVIYNPSTNFGFDEVVTLNIQAQDNFNNQLDGFYSFTCASNVAPVINLPSSLTIQEDSNSGVIDFTPYISDVDADISNLTLTSEPNTHISVLIQDKNVTFTPETNYFGTETITFTVNDNQSRAISTDTIDIIVTPIDDAPTIANEITDIIVDEDAGDEVVDLSNIFTDIDNDDTLIGKTVFSITNSNLLTAVITGDILTLDFMDDEYGQTDVTIRGNSNGLTVDETFSVTINPIDDAPIVANPINDVIVDENSNPVILSLENVFTDIDNVDANISKVILGNTNPALITADLVGNDLTLSFAQNASGSGSITIQATSNGQTVIDNFNVEVNAVDDAPTVANPIDDIVVDEDHEVMTVDLANTFTDIDNDDADIFKSLLSNSNPALINVTVLGNTLTIDFLPNQYGSATVAIRGTSNGKIVDDTFEVTVNAVDDDPFVANPIDDVIVDEDANPYIISLADVFGDIDNDVSQITKVVSQNTNTILVSTFISGDNLTLSFGQNNYGLADLVLTGTSGGKEVSTSFRVVVNSVDDAPYVYNPIADATVNEDDPDWQYTLSNVFKDVDNDDASITVSIESNSNPDLVSATIVNNFIKFSLSENAYGESTIKIKGLSNGLAAYDEFVITVNPVADQPYVANEINDVYAEVNAPNRTIDISNVFYDVDSQIVSKAVTFNNNPTLVSAEVVGNGNTLVLDFLPNQTGNANIQVTATTDDNQIAVAEFQVWVYAEGEGISVVNPIEDQQTFEDASNPIQIDLSNVFASNDPDAEITKSVSSNTNQSLVETNLFGNLLTLTLQENQNGIAVITIMGSANGSVAFDSFEVNVIAVNDDPVLTLPEDISYNEDSSYAVDFDQYISDVDNTVHNITWSQTQNVMISKDGTILTFTASPNWYGQETVTFTIDDYAGGVVSDNVLINVNSVNDSPVANAGGPYQVTDDDDNGFASVILNASNSYDVDGNIVTYAWSWSGGSGNGVQLQNDFPLGSTLVTLTVQDNQGAVDTDEVYVNVVNENSSIPVANDDSYITDEDIALNLTIDLGVLANDVNDNIASTEWTASLRRDVMHGNLTLNEDGSFSYIPDQDFFGSDSFTYTAFDGFLYSNVATVTITVNEVNDAPSLNLPVSFTFNEDESLDIDFSQYISDVDNTQHSITWSGNINVMISVDGMMVTLASVADWNGTENITFTVSDGDLETTDTVQVIVDAINDAPIAMQDTYPAFLEDTSLNIDAPGVLANDSDVENDAILAYLLVNGEHGTAILNQDGSFTYTPNANYNGTDSFTYFVTDGPNNSEPVTVNLVISPVNDAPTINLPTQLVFDEDTSLEVDFSTYASDIDGDILSISYSGNTDVNVSVDNMIVTLTATQDWVGSEILSFNVEDPSGLSDSDNVVITVNQVNDAPVANADSFEVEEDNTLAVLDSQSLLINDTDDDYPGSLSVELVSDVNHGSLILENNGTFIYTPEENYFGTDTFTYRTFDSELYSQPTTVTIVINEANDAPVISLPSVITFDEDTEYLVDFTDYISDIDNSLNDLTLTASTTANINVAINGFNVTFSAPQDWVGSENVVFTVNDNEGRAIDTDNVLVTVNQVNDAPIASADIYDALEGFALNVGVTNSVLINDNDDNYPSELTAVLYSNVSHGELILNPNGTFTYTSYEDYNGEDSFVYRAYDGASFSDFTEVTINVAPVDDTPEIILPPSISFSEDSELVHDFSSYVTDPDTDLENITLSASGNNEIDIEINGFEVTFTANEDWNGQETITFIVNDGNSSANGSTIVRVTPVNDAPVLSMIPLQEVPEDGTLTITLNGSDVDEDELSYSAESLSSFVSVDVNNDQLTMTPATDWNGSASISVTVSDGVLQSSKTFTLNVLEVNDAPIVSNPINDYVKEEDFTDNIVINLDNHFDDIDGDILTYTVSSGDNLLTSIEGNILTVSSVENYHGIQTVTVTASDNNSRFAKSREIVQDVFQVEITPVNDAPEMVAVADQTTTEDFSLTITLSAIDVDDELAEEGTTFTYSAISPAYIETTISGNQLTMTPEANWNGETNISVSVSDGELQSQPVSFVLTVNPANDAPVVSAQIPDFEREEDFEQMIQINLNNYFDDIDGDVLSYSASLTEDIINVVIEENLMTITSKNDANGSTQVTVTASDGNEKFRLFSKSDRATVQNSFMVNITPVNDAPVIDENAFENLDFVTNGEIVITEGQQIPALDFSLIVSDVDQNLDDLILSVSGNDYLDVDINGLVATITAPQFWAGEELLTFMLDDGSGRISVSLDVKITVKPKYLDERVELEYHTLSWKTGYQSKIDITSQVDVNKIKGKIFDKKGKKIKDLSIVVNGDNKRLAVWDGKNADGNDVNGGFYIYQITVDGKIYQGSIVVAR